jgi:flagellar hook-associated protein 1 FlgK
MDQLSERLNYTYTTAATGEVTIQFGTTIPIMLVDPLVPPGSTPLTRVDLDPPNAYANGDLTSGSLFADMDVVQNIVPNIYMANMDALVADLVTDLNAAHAAGFDLAGAAGLSMFNPIGMSALTMSVDAGLMANPSLLAAASSWAGTGEPGNGGNINSMLAQRALAQGAPLNASWDNYYAGTVADLGTRIQTTQRTIATQEAVVSVLEGRRNEVSGVSLDEEMSNMMRFQNAYNASARVLTAMDDALDTLINRMGRVGL